MSTSLESTKPWDNSNADIVLRSSDGQHFKADKPILARTFQAFEDMFSGTDIGTGEVQERQDGRVVVDLSESSVVLETLLRLIYCMNTRLAHLDTAAMLDVCIALDKYCVKLYPCAVMDRLIALAGEEPELAYIRACRFRLYEVARAAATASLRVTRLFSNVQLSELNISAQQYHVLMSYRADCYEKAVGAVEDFVWMDRLEVVPPGLSYDRSCETCYRAGPRAWLEPNLAPHLNLSPASRKVVLKPRPIFASSWLSRYLELVEAALAKNASGAVAKDQRHIHAVFGTENAVCCDGCRTAGHALGMVDFAERLAREIDARISTVPFSVPGVDWSTQT